MLAKPNNSLTDLPLDPLDPLDDGQNTVMRRDGNTSTQRKGAGPIRANLGEKRQTKAKTDKNQDP
jgi:hypothetical protein